MPDVTNRQEVQVKSTMKRPLTPARTAVSSKPTSTCWRGRGGKGALVHRGPDRTPVRPPWETAQRLPEKPKPEPARDPAIPLLSVSLKKTKNLIWKDTRTRVHCRVIHDSRDAGAPEGSRGMSGQSSGTATRADVARPQKGRHPATGNVDGHEGAAPSDVSQTEEDTTTRPRSHAELKSTSQRLAVATESGLAATRARGGLSRVTGSEGTTASARAASPGRDAWRVTAGRTLHPVPGSRWGVGLRRPRRQEKGFVSVSGDAAGPPGGGGPPRGRTSRPRVLPRGLPRRPP